MKIMLSVILIKQGHFYYVANLWPVFVDLNILYLQSSVPSKLRKHSALTLDGLTSHDMALDTCVADSNTSSTSIAMCQYYVSLYGVQPLIQILSLVNLKLFISVLLRNALTESEKFA